MYSTQRQQQKTNSFKRLAIISTVEFITERLFLFSFHNAVMLFFFFFSTGLPQAGFLLRKHSVWGGDTELSMSSTTCWPTGRDADCTKRQEQLTASTFKTAVTKIHASATITEN